MILTIRKKLIGAFGFVIVLMMLTNAMIVRELQILAEGSNIALTADGRAVDAAKQLRGVLTEQSSYAQKYLALRDSTYQQMFQDQDAVVEELLNALHAAGPDVSEAVHLLRIQFGYRRVSQALAGVNERDLQPLPPLAQMIDSLRVRLDTVIAINQSSIAAHIEQISASSRRAAQVALILTLCSICASVVAAIVLSRSITRPIAVLRQGTEQVARGSFQTIAVTSRDEIALLTRAFNGMADKLKRINEMKAEIMQRISHELRTPLQAMLSAHYLLTEQRLGQLNADQLRLLGSIRDSIDKLSSFSHQFLDIAKVEAGMMEYRLERAELLDVVRPALEQARLIAVRKEIAIELTSAPAPPVMIDLEKIGQVVTNLLTNAIKYTPKGGAIIVNTSPCEGGVRIAVQDSGVGIASEDLPHVFTKFYQARNASRTESKGTGVGLALVKAFVEGHGGTVSVSSSPGLGSTFTVELPAAPADGAPASPTVQKREQVHA